MIVLMYHCVYSTNPEETGFQNSTAFTYKLSSEKFEEQVKTISEYLENNSLPKSTVEFTFDDGGVSFYTVIKPILEKYGFKGIFFVATNQIGSIGFMSADQIRGLANAGHIIGSHSHTHPERMDIMSKTELEYEWTTSRKILSQILGSTIETASIPNGFSSKAVLSSMINAGYIKNYISKPTTSIKRVGSSSVIGRYAITNDMSTAQVLGIVSSRRRRMKIECRDAILGIAKAVLGNFYLIIRKKILS